MRIKMFKQTSVFILVALLIACTAAPPKFVTSSQHPLLEKDGGTKILMDVCLQHNVLVGTDYFVVQESRADAVAVFNASSKYLSTNGVKVERDYLSLVCAAQHDASNSPKHYAETLDATLVNSSQPFNVPETIANDAQYVEALTKFSTFVFQRGLVSKIQTNKTDSESTNKFEPFINLENFKSASAIVANRTKRSSLLYIGVTGNSQSSGKKFAQTMAQFVVGVATAVAIGPIPVGPNTMAVSVFPPSSIDAWQIVAGLVDLELGQVLWTNVIHGYGDPMKPEIVSQSHAVNILLHDLVNKSSSTWTPPGAKPQ